MTSDRLRREKQASITALRPRNIAPLSAFQNLAVHQGLAAVVPGAVLGGLAGYMTADSDDPHKFRRALLSAGAGSLTAGLGNAGFTLLQAKSLPEAFGRQRAALSANMKRIRAEAAAKNLPDPFAKDKPALRMLKTFRNQQSLDREYGDFQKQFLSRAPEQGFIQSGLSEGVNAIMDPLLEFITPSNVAVKKASIADAAREATFRHFGLDKIANAPTHSAVRRARLY